MGAERLHHVGEKVKSDLAPMESYSLHGQLAPMEGEVLVLQRKLALMHK